MTAGDAIFSPGTQTTVITGASSRAAGAFSVEGECTELSDNLYPLAKAVLSCSFSSAPTEGDLVHLFRRDMNVDGTNDETVPEAGYNVHYLGSFPVKDVTAQQYITLDMVPLTEGDQQFFIQNDADQTMDSDYVVKITPLTYIAEAS